MTTEVLRNMLFAALPQLAGLGLVVLDEVHYLQDPYRGSVWEEVIILTPPEWSSCACRPRCPTPASSAPGSRPVRGPDRRRSWRRTARWSCATTWPSPRRGAVASTWCRCCDEASSIPEAAALDERMARLARRPGGAAPLPRWPAPGAARSSRRSTSADMLPAIVFIFSPAACDDAVRQCLDDGCASPPPSERAEIRRRCEEHTEGLPDDELRVLGYGPLGGRPRGGPGLAPRRTHPRLPRGGGGLLPANLLQVVFATETLALGINMPARTRRHRAAHQDPRARAQRACRRGSTPR